MMEREELKRRAATAEDAAVVDKGYDEVQADAAFAAEDDGVEQAPPDPLSLLGYQLSGKRTEAIRARSASGVERRWLEDLDSYHGRDAGAAGPSMVTAASQGINSEGLRARMGAPRGERGVPRSTVFVQLTRQKTNAASARLADMLYPTDDRNWAIQPTPVPELMQALTEHGNVEFKDPKTNGTLPHPTEDRKLTVGDLAAEKLKHAKQASDAMQKEIEDAFTECSYNFEGRKAIQDAAVLGTGILKGPIVTNRISKKWAKKQTADGKAVHVLAISEDMRPATKRVDPWNFYPDPACGENPQNGSFVWEREYVTGRGMRDLARCEGYKADQIVACLEEGPQHYTADGAYRPERNADGDYIGPNAYEDSRFELWTYVGEVSVEDLAACGVNVPRDYVLAKISAVVVMCNERVIKAIVNPMDTGDFPYDVFQWETVSGSPWGVGIPFLMRYAQRTLNAAWRAMLDNMGVSHAPQIVVNRDAIEPADGQWRITGRKLWYAKKGVEDVQKAFWVFPIQSNQADLAAIIQMAMKFADDETSLPQIAQGEMGSAPDRVGVVNLLMNSANVVLRRLVKQYDDLITRPHVRRYYDWFMQYSDKEEIKGDYQVDARGSTALMVRDQAQMALQNLMQMAGHPVFGAYIDPKKLFRKAVESNHIPADDVMRSDIEIAQNEARAREQPPPPPLPVQVAQIRAEAEKEAVKIESESERVNQQMRMQEARDNRAGRLAEMQLERDLLILKFAHEKGMQIDDIKAQLAMHVIDNDAKARVKQADAMARGPASGDPAKIDKPQGMPA